MTEALRLLFEWAGGSIRLKSVERVAKRAPASDPPQRRRAKAETTGIVLELRDGAELVYQRQVGAMFPDSHEVQTGDAERPFKRAPRSKPYTVEIVVPSERAKRLLLTERRATPDAKGEFKTRATVHVDEHLLREDESSEPKGS